MKLHHKSHCGTKEESKALLGPYNTSDSPITIVIVTIIVIIVPYCPHIVISVPRRSPLLLLLYPYIIIFMLGLIIL